MTQRDRLLRLLEEHAGHWVDLPRILELGIAQYNSRIWELRRELEPEGYRIESRVVRSNGRVRSWFRLLPPQPAQRELELGGRGEGIVGAARDFLRVHPEENGGATGVPREPTRPRSSTKPSRLPAIFCAFTQKKNLMPHPGGASTARKMGRKAE